MPLCQTQRECLLTLSQRLAVQQIWAYESMQSTVWKSHGRTGNAWPYPGLSLHIRELAYISSLALKSC